MKYLKYGLEMQQETEDVLMEMGKSHSRDECDYPPWGREESVCVWNPKFQGSYSSMFVGEPNLYLISSSKKRFSPSQQDVTGYKFRF